MTSWVSEGFKSAVETFNTKQKDGICIDITFTTERMTEQRVPLTLLATHAVALLLSMIMPIR
jgi:hypothetical protein